MPGSLRTLPLDKLHSDLGARLGEFAGWRMPLWYSGAVNEVNAVRQAAGIFDISHMGRFKLQGDRAAEALSTVFSRDLGPLPVGRATYALACNQEGGILDDLMIYRLGATNFLVVCNAANVRVIGDILQQASKGLDLTDGEPDTVFLAIQGPDAVSTLESTLGDVELGLKPRGCTEIDANGELLFVARTGYTGEDGVEVLASAAAGENLVRQLLERGCLPCGLASRDVLRLEASLPLYGLDIDETTTPWEAGLGWAVKLDHDFTGRDALAALKGAEARQLSCLISDGAGIFRSHNPINQDGVQVSSTSSGGFSPTLDRSIAMAYLPNALTAPGTQFEIDVRGRGVPCHVVSRPFYRSQSRPT